MKKMVFFIFLFIFIYSGFYIKLLSSKELDLSNLSNLNFEKAVYDYGRLLSLDIPEKEKLNIIKKYKNFFSNKNETLLILMYHDFYRDSRDTMKKYSVTVEDFENHLQILKELNFESVSMMDVYYYVKFGKKIPERSVLLTFDDGYKKFMYIYPILKKYGYKGVISLITGYVGSSWELNKDQIKLLKEEGLVEFASHSDKIHNEFKKMLQNKKYDEIEKDIKKSRDFFNSMNIETIAFTYPLSYGSHDEKLQKILLKYGFKMAFSGWNDRYVKPNSNIFSISRIEVSIRNGLNTKEKFKTFLLNYLENKK
ncbi:MAG: polysaccharide deacetylase family protein [Caldisericia bacterium]